MEAEGIVDRAFWLRCGEEGLLCPSVPEACGGLGLDLGYNAIIDEEFAYANCTTGIGLQSNIVADYLVHYGTEDQKQRWLSPMIRREVITAIAMTEPGTGSDLQGIRSTARRDGDDYIVNGSKTYITNGQNADLVIVVARTGGEGAKGISLILVEADREGFKRGRNVDKIGQHAADTSERFFSGRTRAGLEPAGERGARLRLPDEPTAPGTSCHRHRRSSLGPARAGRGRGLHP